LPEKEAYAMPQLQENPTQLSWAQEVYRALGWTFEEIEAAEALSKAPVTESDPVADLAQTLSATERQIEAETAITRLQEVTDADTTTRDLSELNLDLEEQEKRPDASPLARRAGICQGHSLAGYQHRLGQHHLCQYRSDRTQP